VRRRNLVDGPTLPVTRLAALAVEFGLSAECARLDWRDLHTRPFAHPLVLVLANTNAVILMGVRRGADEVAVSDPLFRDGEIFYLARAELEKSWHGQTLIIAPLPPSREDAKFGFSWFTRKLFAERRLIRDVVIAALAMHLIALSVPIFFQILVDKVVPNQALDTLYTITAGVFILIPFDSGFNYMRNYLLAFITRKLDHVIATDTVAHLLTLPIDYFHANPSGITAYKLQEANNVRDFLASRLFNTFLDFLSVVIFLPVLLIYSWQLTLIVLAVSAIGFITLAVMSREFRLKLRDVNEIEGRRKAFLFEILPRPRPSRQDLFIRAVVPTPAPGATQTEGLSGYIIRLTQGFSFRCLRFASDAASSRARLASSWRTPPLPGGRRTLWIASRGFRLHPSLLSRTSPVTKVV